MDIGTRLFTWLNGEAVGTDRYGNRYFQDRKDRPGRRRRRWVMYAGTPDASKVPPEWHAWLERIRNNLGEPARLRGGP